MRLSVYSQSVTDPKLGIKALRVSKKSDPLGEKSLVFRRSRETVYQTGQPLRVVFGSLVP